MAKSYNMFTDLKNPRDITGYTLYRGTTDFTQLQQFDLFESGYPYLIVVSIPEFLTKMAELDASNKNEFGVASLIENYKHILEYEFKGLDSGLENLTAESDSISNGIQSINVITKSRQGDGGITFSMRYNEKAGGILTKTHELYIRSVRDPASGFKTYNGLIGDVIDPNDAGFHKETFSFLYIHTDNTGLLVERAAYLVGCMPTTANIEIYNGTKGDPQFQEITCEFTGFPIQGSQINKRAKEILDWMNSEANANMVHRNSWDYDYAGIHDTGTGLAQAKLTKN